MLYYLFGTPHARLALHKHNEDGFTRYFDAAFSDSLDCLSMDGYLLLYHGSPISWASKLERTIALSTVESEFMMGFDAYKELIWIRSVICGIGLFDNSTLPTILWGDSTSAIALARNYQFHQRTKHIELCERFITFLINKSIITVIHIPTSEILIDGVTKPFTIDRHNHQAERMGVDLNLTYHCGTCKSVSNFKHYFDTNMPAKGHVDKFTVRDKRKRVISKGLVSEESLGIEAIPGNG